MPAHDVIMPKIGMYMEDIRLVEWLKEEGAEVEPGELLFTLETDKVTSDVEAEEAGFLHRIVDADSMVPIGTVVGVIATTREEYDALVASGSPGASAAEEAATGAPSSEFAPAQSELFLNYIRATGDDGAGVPAPPVSQPPPPRAEPPVAQRQGGRPVSPRARALIAEAGLTPEVVETIPASGPGGRLTDKDVRAFLEAGGATESQQTKPAPLVDVAVAERIPLRGRRGVIARRMMESLQATAQLTSILEIDVSRIVEWRAQADARPGYASIFVAVAAHALRRHPLLNARVVDDAIEVLADVNIAVAVATDDGVIAPVVLGADRLSLAELDARIADLRARAREGRVTLRELDGATFTVSSSGSAPVDITTAIINPPQVAILWLGRIRDRAVAVDGQLAVRPTIQACLTYDHRAVDGLPAAAFLGTVEELCAAFPAFLEGR